MSKKVRLAYVGDYERRGFLYHEYEMLVGDESVGECFLKEGDASRIMTLGNVGYYVREEHRGNAYAAAALTELLRFAPKYNIDRLVICCKADNIASVKSCVRAGAHYNTTVTLDEKDDSYAYGTRCLKRYFLDVPDNKTKKGENK